MTKDVSNLRQSLSDELHARASYDFNGTGRFIRFVYLVGDDDSRILKYVNEYLLSESLPEIDKAEKFHRIDCGKYVLRVERHAAGFGQQTHFRIERASPRPHPDASRGGGGAEMVWLRARATGGYVNYRGENFVRGHGNHRKARSP